MFDVLHPIVLALFVFMPLCYVCKWLYSHADKSKDLAIPASFACYAAVFYLLVLGPRGMNSEKIRGSLDTAIYAIVFFMVSTVYVKFWLQHLGESVAGAVRGSLPPDPPMYDLAEAAEKRRDYARAKSLFLEGTKKFPKDPYPWARLASLHCKAQEYRDALRCLGEARNRTEDPQNWADLCFRISDLLAKELGDRKAALAELEGVVQRYPQQPCARQARKRMEILGQTPSPP